MTVPIRAKLAAVEAYVAKTGSCQPAAMHAALEAAFPEYNKEVERVGDAMVAAFNELDLTDEQKQRWVQLLEKHGRRLGVI